MKILLIASTLALSASVAMAKEHGATLVIVDHSPGSIEELAGIVIEKANFSLTDLKVYNPDILAAEALRFEVVRQSYREEYAGLKLNNKALPITNRLWLINCQIALK